MYYCNDADLIKNIDGDYTANTDLDIFCDLLGNQAKIVIPEELLRIIFKNGNKSNRVNLFVNVLYEMVMGEDREGFGYSDEECLLMDFLIEKIGVFGAWKGDGSDV